MSIHAAFTKASPDFGRTSAPKVARLPGIDGDTARATESLLASLWSAQRRKEGWIHPDAIPSCCPSASGLQSAFLPLLLSLIHI